MTPPMYIYRIFHGPGSRARALLNGVPLYDRIVTENVSPAQPITHWLVSGDNTLTVELSPEPRPPNIPGSLTYFEFSVRAVKEGIKIEEVEIFKWIFPNTLKEKELPAVLPLVHSEVFHISADLPEPAYAKATREEFPKEGTPELRAAVFELYDSFASRDAARFEKAMEVKSGEFDRYYELPANSKADAMEQMNAPWIMEPFNEEDLRFERHLDGRLVKVSRESGRPAVGAVHRDEPYLGWGTDFFLTRLDGRWRIYW